MVLIYHNIYCRKCVAFWIASVFMQNFVDHLKGQSFKAASSGFVYTGYRAILNISESLNKK